MSNNSSHAEDLAVDRIAVLLAHPDLPVRLEEPADELPAARSTHEVTVPAPDVGDSTAGSRSTATNHLLKRVALRPIRSNTSEHEGLGESLSGRGSGSGVNRPGSARPLPSPVAAWPWTEAEAR